MTLVENRIELSPQVRRLLARVRRLLRRYVWTHGLALTLATAGMLFWLGLAIDWFFEPPHAFRQGMLVIAGVLLLAVLSRSLLRRLLVPLSDASMAVLLERRFQGFEDSLLTSVEYASRVGDMPDAYGRQMLAHTFEMAAERSGGLDVADVFDFGPRRRSVAAALALAASIVGFSLLWPQAFRIGVARLATLSDESWPRRTRLVVDGFADGEAVIAKGSDLELVVKADTSMEIPGVVQVHFRYDDGERGRATMFREGNAEPARDPYQTFKYVFSSVPASLRFDVRGGDARLRDLRIRVVDSPTLEMSLGCRFPDYTRLAQRQIPVTGVMPLARGTQVTIYGRANKDLVQVRVDVPDADGSFSAHTISPDQQSGSRREFEYTVQRLDADTVLQFRLLDSDGIQNREPIRLALAAVPDDPPQVDVRLAGIGSAITPLARLPLAGEITDDYGVASADIEYTVDQQPPQTRPFAATIEQQNKLPVEEALEVRDLDLKPGQRLLVGTRATDNRRLPDEPEANVAQGERFLLEVVTPAQLRAILETEELNLRQRFEATIAEMVETRDWLLRLSGQPRQTSGELPGDGQSAGDGQPQARSDDTSEGSGPAAATEEQQVADRLIIERALQNSRKDAEETLGVAVAFDLIRQQLINNRVDTEELRLRLKDYIADPLRQIAARDFPDLDRRLALLAQAVTDVDAAPRRQVALQDAVAQADRVIVAMQQVRDKMLELETFNEALDLLRAIIAGQQEISERTKKQRVEKLRGLLD